MFDFAWSEFALIGVVALLAIGPKDMPAAIRTVTGVIKKARKMAAEFQTHVDEMVREADLGEVRDQVRQLRNFDLRGEIARHVDADGSIRSAINDDPFKPTPPVWKPVTPPAPDAPDGETITAETGSQISAEAHPALWQPPEVAPVNAPDAEAALAFVPPWAANERAERDAAPAFIPPTAATHHKRADASPR